MPDAAGEVYVLALIVVVDEALDAKKEALFHAKAHIVDGSLALVVECPVDLFVSHSVKHRLLDLCLENLAVLGGTLWQSLKLGSLHIELGGCTPHANQLGACGN